MSKIINNLWVEKFRPSILSEYVGNEDFKQKIQGYLDEGEIPHLLLYGHKPGTGKTTAAKLIANHLDCDFLYINASSENNVDTIRTKVTNFVSTVGFKKWKIVILDEFDFTTPNAQAALRNILETFSKTARFILTCNYVEKIIEPIQSRCLPFHILPPSKTEVAKRCATILKTENIEFENKDLATIITKSYPDMRRIINALQSNSKSGKLIVDTQSTMEANYMEEVLEVLKTCKTPKDGYTAIRKIIADSRVKSFDELYRFLFDHLEEFVPNGKQGNCILIIAETLQHDPLVVDKEINVAAMIVKLLTEIKS